VGVRGYLLKTSTAAHIADAVRRVHRGEPVFSPELALVVLERCGGPAQLPDAQRLSQLQRKALRMLAEGSLFSDVATALGMGDSALAATLDDALSRVRG
jgi:DNA-binding NarL/FixJ family response regulator